MAELALNKVSEILVESAVLKEMLKWTVEQLKFISEDRNRLEKSYNEETARVKDLEAKLKEAHKLCYDAKQRVNCAIKKRDQLVSTLEEAKDILNDRDMSLQDNARAKLNFLNLPMEELDTIMELDSTDNLMSELSYTIDENDMSEAGENTLRRSQRNKRAPCRFPSDDSPDESQPKRSKGKEVTQYTAGGDEQVIATTTVTVPFNGPVTATSVIEALPSPQIQIPHTDLPYILSPPLSALDTDTETTSSEEAKLKSSKVFSCQTNMRLHNWNQKSHIMGESCTACSKRIKFSSVVYKCSNCRGVAHTDCKDMVPLPCVPKANTPTAMSCKRTGCISDYAPQTSPMVPAIVVHCIREIESRGLNEVGLYRVPGSDKEVKTLKEKLLKAKGVIDLSDIPDINTVCGCLKEFLRSLKETLIPQKRWNELANASGALKGEAKKNEILRIIQSLPQPNRDTLSYIVLHLQRVAAAPNCKMPVANLSKMFGPNIVGYSKYKPEHILVETNISNKIMAEFLLIPSECYEELLYSNDSENQNPELQKTPSQNSLFAFLSDSASSIKTVKKLLK